MANYNLGRLSSRVVSRNNFSVTPGDRTDVFKFNIANRRQIGLYLHGMNGDADIYLFRDTNGNGRWDRSDQRVDFSRLSGTRNDTIDYTANRGTYFARVVRFSGPTRLRYDLDLAATYDVGTLGTSPISRNRYSVNASDPTDVFEFDTTGTRTINLSLNRISSGDDVDLRLYRDNGNGVFDASDRVVARSSNGSNRDDMINYRGARGTYFAEARRFSGTGSATYDLDMSATTSRASNLIGTEVQVGNLSSDVTRSGSVSSSDTNDTYAFSLGRFEGANIRLSGLSRDADIRLIRDRNNNAIVDPGEVVGSSTRSGTAIDTINNITQSGNYILQVYQFSGNTSYRVTFDHFNIPFTYDVGTLGASPISRNRFSVTAANPTDVFEFDTTGTRTINLSLNRISSGDDVDLRLYRDNGNGVFDAGDRVVARSSNGSNRDDMINYRGARGTYFAEARRFSGTGSAFYDLDMSATISRASNLIGTEVQVGNLSRDLTRFGSVSSSDTNDTYAFSLGRFEGVNLRLSGLSSDADIRLIRDRNNNAIVDPGEVVGSSTRAGTAIDTINNINQSGNYILQVYQFSGNTSYRLTFDHFNTPFP